MHLKGRRLPSLAPPFSPRPHSTWPPCHFCFRVLRSRSLSPSRCSPPSLSLSLSLSARVAFRNLFVIKAAIYFTLIEKIGRLPLPATIYHDRTRSRPPLFFAFSPPQKIIMPRMYVPARCNCGTFPGLPRTSRLLNRECKWQLEIFGRDAKESRGIPGI